jgi:hypothetical protein
MRKLAEVKIDWEKAMVEIHEILTAEIKTYVEGYVKRAEAGLGRKLNGRIELFSLMETDGFWEKMMAEDPFENVGDVNNDYLILDMDWGSFVHIVTGQMIEEYGESEWKPLFAKKPVLDD